MLRAGLRSSILLTCSLIGAAASCVGAQVSPAEFRKLLTDEAAFQPDELTALDAGKLVVKVLPSQNKQIVSVFGIVRLPDISDISMPEFRSSLTQRSNKALKAGGKFSLPPTIEDLNDLELEDKDISALKKCIVGNCDMNLSAELIKKISAELDSSSVDQRQRATALIREMLLQFIVNYSLDGDRSLGQYANRKQAFDLAESHHSLLADTVIVNDLFPELITYFSGFPSKALAGIESEMHWSTVDFGLKPAITLTHTAAFKTTNGYIVGNKQIYASRYIDSSISFSLLVGFGANDKSGYLIFVDRSQSDALGGMFSGLTKGIVEKEAIEKVTSILQNTERRLIAANKRNNEDAPETERQSEDGIAALMIQLLTEPKVAVPALIVLAAAAFLLLRRRARS